MQAIDLATAEALIDFSGKQDKLKDLARQQLVGTVALHNILIKQSAAYLADEVGMGKTYIALGVVALMRRFKPDLRVLYLLPKNNVRDKWEKDYKSFVEHNYKLRDFSVKGLGNRPAVRYAVSSSLPDLIQSIATDSARDHFICTSAFSFSLGATGEDLKASLDRFKKLLPQNRDQADKIAIKVDNVTGDTELQLLKNEVKHCWASALHAIMPRFDLVVVDEAHNLKKGSASSDRNQLLATLMGADGGVGQCKAEHVLLLSATPFDRDLEQLRNQFALFGKAKLLTVDRSMRWEDANNALKTFMVRRLNEIEINKKPHTRNMYRVEYRRGEEAELDLKLEQQLFAAVLQKKVSESLHENCSGKFELGMLSSFESYLPGEKGKLIEFDGQEDRISERDAPDRNIVQHLVQDYRETFGERPPHPKMDAVAIKTCHTAFELGKKQLIFVRRVRSVSELKSKIESAYDEWIGHYVQPDSSVYYWFERYRKLKPQNDASLVEGDSSDEGGDSSPSSFFTWFYRGKNDELVTNAALVDAKETIANLGQLPHNFRNMLASTSMMFELNWATLANMPPPCELNIDWSCGGNESSGTLTMQSRFRHLQFAYLKAASNADDPRVRKVAKLILEVLFANFKPNLNLSDETSLESDLLRPTLWNRLHESESLRSLFPDWTNETFTSLAGDDYKKAESYLKRLLIHQELIGVVCRLDHPFIDLYSVRNARKDVEKGFADQNDQNLINAFVNLLMQQVNLSFSSFKILHDIASNLDILIKLNFEDAYQKKSGELTQYLARQLSPLAPVIGATGENSSSRSPMARKFRMPGYPCVLISTNVFQEGEDLHTFCDSIIHYGISASPIALEQKIGRVDRIGSLSHRALGNATQEHSQHFIKVTYPHIRQSLEFFQVRQASRNLNAFHLSLHKLETESNGYRTELTVKDQLGDGSTIPPQILERLLSPFSVDLTCLSGANFVKQIAQQQMEIDARLLHAKERVEICITEAMRCTSPVILTENVDGLTHAFGASDVVVQLRSAQGGPELLLALSCLSTKQVKLDQMLPIVRLNNLYTLQFDEKARYQLLDDKYKRTVLTRNVEVYAGGKNILSDLEVRDALHRLDETLVESEIANPAIQAVLASMVTDLCVDYGALHISETQPGSLHYYFEIEDREQVISWLVKGSHVLVTSRVISAAETIGLAEDSELLINSTLRRNGLFDVVDFHINERNELAVRALYPLSHLNQVELAFVFLSVAREADRLQYILRSGCDEEDDVQESIGGGLPSSRTLNGLSVV